ncbi:MAG TPA: alpha-amylase family glycosyl hydrolase, partial [Bacteroidales bacterium]
TTSYLVQGTTKIATLPSGVHDGINYINDSTVTFVLFAPYKKSVYLIGDFNNWTPSNSYLMNEDTALVPYLGTYNAIIDASGNTGTVSMVRDSDRFWITVKNLTPGKEYAFQYLIDGNIRIADPYSEKILDPANDKYISSSIYPNLMPYPSDKTTGIVGVIQTNQTPYQWQVSSFIPPDKNKLVIYELLIRDFTAKRDIKTVMDSLTYLKRLGVNAIELMPFSEFDGNDSWGYNPCFYFAPDKAYGTRENYKSFIDACHQNGIAVIQDMVLDFSTGNSPLVQMYFANNNPSIQNPWYNVVPPVGSYTASAGYGYDFNHSSPYTQQFTDSVTSFWMKEYKIDGFRFDMAKGWTNTPGTGDGSYDQPRINILKNTASHIWHQNPNAYVILELFTGNTEEDTLSNHGMMMWGNMNNAYEQASIGNSSSISGISYKALGWNYPNLVGYMESHDEQREMYFNETLGKSGGIYNIKDTTTALKRMELDNAFFLPVPGPKMIWQFGELGYDTSINYNSRVGIKPLLWKYYNDSRRRHLFNVVSALINLKKNCPAFSTTNFSMDGDMIKHIELLGKDTTIEILGNFDIYGNAYTLTLPSIGKWFEYFTGDSITISSSSYSFSLQPGEYRLYSNKRLIGFHSIATPVKQITDDTEDFVYPNPFSNDLYLDKITDAKKLEITNLQGQKVLETNGKDIKHIDTSNLPSGLYFVTIYSENGNIKVFKIIKL